MYCRWTRCHLSGADLSPPCVIDELGTLYNKDALLEALLKKTLPPQLAYITGLKSVTELKLTPHQAAAQVREQVKAAVKGLHNPGNEAAFCCPVTGLEFNGRWVQATHTRIVSSCCCWPRIQPAFGPRHRHTRSAQ